MYRKWKPMLREGLAVVLLASPAMAQRLESPVGWRGDGSGRFAVVRPPVKWNAETGENILWRTRLEDRSNASPIVVGDKVLVNAEPSTLLCLDVATGKLVWRRPVSLVNLLPAEAARPFLAMLKEREDAARAAAELNQQAQALKEASRSDDKSDEQKAALRAEAGDRQREQRDAEGKVRDLTKTLAEVTGELGMRWNKAVGYSMSTPVSDGVHVWVKYATGAVACVDLDGNVVWLRRFDYDGTESSAPSPLLVDGKLVFSRVPHDPGRRYRNEKTERSKIVAALNAATGETVWETAPLRNAGWGSGGPVAMHVGGAAVIATGGGDVLRASDGRVLASEVAMGGSSTAIAHGDTLYMCDDKVMRAVRLAEAPDGTLSPTTLWTVDLVENPGNSFGVWSSPVYHDGRIYAVDGEGRGFVVQAADGSVAGRFEPFEGLRGKPFPYASLAVAGPYLYVAAAKKAEVAVWRHGPSPSVVAVNDGLGSSLNSSPFFAGKRLFLRTEDELICIGEP